MIPSLAHVRIENPHWRGLRLWLPLFLLWIPLLLVAPLILLVLLAVCLAGRISFLRAVRTLWGLLCGLRGTDVRVVADGNRVTVRIL